MGSFYLLISICLLCQHAAAQHPLNVFTPGVASSAEELEGVLWGEPYRLSGKRIVFTNWFYVRPGVHLWVDDQGQAVSGNPEAKIEDWGAHFKAYDMPRGVRLVAQPAERRQNVIPTEKPWEKRFRVYTLIQLKDKLAFWAECPEACYLESVDGVRWTRPSLGLVEYNGNKDNNLIPSIPGDTVFIDPAAPPEQRYKSVGLAEITEEEWVAYQAERPGDWDTRARRTDAKKLLGLKGSVSADGIHWNPLKDVLSVEHADTQNVGTYDALIGKYVVYTRQWWVGEQAPSARGTLEPNSAWISPGRRSIGRSESSTFEHFPVSETVLVPSPDFLPSEVLYTNCKTTIPGQPDNHIMFPAVWNMDSDTTRLVVASSSDGKVWNWVPGGTVLETGNFGTFDGGTIFASPNLVEFKNGDFALPYNGFRFPHKYPRGGAGFPANLGFAVWPKGRIVAVEAKGMGEFTTVAFIPPGNKLRINAVTTRAGYIKVACCKVESGGVNLRPLPGRDLDDCEPIIGDQYQTRVTWGSEEDMGIELDAPVALRFEMNQAKLFSLEFD